MKLKELLATRVRKLLVCGILIIIIATLTNFVNEGTFGYSIMAILFGLSLLYPLWFFVSSVYYAIKNIFKK